MSTYNCFRLARDDRNVLSVCLDVPDRSFNVITLRVLAELESIVAMIEADPSIELVLFRSGKPTGFLAGADIHAFLSHRPTSHSPAAEEDERAIDQILCDGQKLFNRIENLTPLTVIAIDGVCLGGGLEWALACNHRIISDSKSTKLGLPEIRLGLLPAWGGTQRLPAQIGLSHALKMILTGKPLDARQAFAQELCDTVLPAQDFQLHLAKEVSSLLERHLKSDSLEQGTSKRRRTQAPAADNWTNKLMDHFTLGRKFIFRKAKQQIATRDPNGFYPAALLAIDAVEQGLQDRQAGLHAERTAFTHLLRTSTAQHLIGLFFQRERARKQQTWLPLASQSSRTVRLSSTESFETASPQNQPIERVVVIGGGAMGAGIAHWIASHDMDVTIQELDSKTAKAATERLDQLTASWRKHHSATNDDEQRLRSHLSVTTQTDAIPSADLVIEAVVERLDVKRQVFQQTEPLLADDAIMVTNTSSLLVHQIAEVMPRPEQVAGLHFFNPVARMELVEVVQTTETSMATTERLLRFLKAIGKTPIVTADAPGFVVNRVLFPYLGEAIQMVAEGFDASQIDQEMEKFGMPMGPLELLDHVGIDIASHVAASLATILPHSECSAQELQRMLDKQRRGKKNGNGFYRYRNGTKRGPFSEGKKLPTASVTGIQKDGLSVTQRRLLYPMVNEAIRCLDHHVVRESWMVDLAMVLGTGFAPAKGGPLQWLEEAGPEIVQPNMQRLFQIYGPRYQPASGLVARWLEKGVA